MAIFGSSPSSPTGQIKRDPRKAGRFFEHAAAAAETRNFDYAIECYIHGLRYDPDNLKQHEALRDVALKRRAASTKTRGFSDWFKRPGKDPLDRFCHALTSWAKDPRNAVQLVEVMARAVDLGEFDSQLNMGPVAYWLGTLTLDTNRAAPKPSKPVYVKARDLFTRLRAFDKAVESCSLALQLDHQDADLLKSLKNLEAERTIQEGGYEQGFRQSIKDTEKQRELEQQDALAHPKSAADELIARRRAVYDEDPQDLDRMLKLVEALVKKEEDPAEQEAINLLQEAWETTGQHRFKVRVGDIRMRQLGRQLRQLQAKALAAPEDDAARRQWTELARRKLQFELDEYTDRAQNYPTDLGIRYELGKRLFAFNRHDEAIGAFQQAKADPRYRAVCHEYLGRCYMAQGWHEEAADTLRQGIEGHPSREDKLALDLRYYLLQALRHLAQEHKSLQRATEAQSVASHILQTDINFRDIRQQMEDIRKLVQSLRGDQSSTPRP